MKYNILKNKIYLYLTEFFSGMAIMAVELGASRLLAPYFSSSQIVWTIIIATIMIAMAAGNVYGGRSADKHPDPDILYRRFLIAAVWIAAIPVLGKYVILLISGALIITISHHLLVENYASLRRNGRVFWIRRKLADLSREGRPLSQGDLAALYEERRPLYERFADEAVDNKGTPEETAKKILALCGCGCAHTFI